MNGATCHDEINRYTCTCVPGYMGTDCELEQSKNIMLFNYKQKRTLLTLEPVH